ncbi:MAG: hypothetical protein ACXVVQ_14885 [Solirubrobacteraceae bacterium]
MRRIALIALASLLTTASSAAGDATTPAAPPSAAAATATTTPTKPGKPSTLHFDIDGLAAPISGRLPRSLQLTAPPDVRVNLKAIAKRCSNESAKLNECPAASLIGKGKLVVEVIQQGKGSRQVSIPLTVYLHSSNKILAVARVLGWQVVPGTLSTHGGLVILFDPLPAGPPFAGVSYTLNRITMNLGGTRVLKKRKRRTKLTMLRNPATCGGSWPSSVALTFRDGTPTQQIPTPIGCSK